MAERLVPGGSFLNETGTAERLVPGGSFVNETLAVGGGGAQNLDPPLLTNTSTLYAPTVSVGAVSLAPPLLTNSSTLYAPTVSVGAVTVAPPLLTNSSTLYAPTVSTAGATVEPPLLTNTSTLYEPTVTRAALVGADIVGRYHIDEAASGTAPTSLADASGNGYHLNDIAYNSGTMFWTADGSGRRALETNTTGAAVYAKRLAVTSDVLLTYGAKSTWTLEIVIDDMLGTANTERIFALHPTSHTGGSPLAIAVNATDLVVFWGPLAGGNAITFYTRPTGRKVVTVVIDTAQATGSDRVKMYYDGSAQTPSFTNSTITQNSTLTPDTTTELILFNRGSTYNRSPQGTVHYAALYASALTAAQVLNNANILLHDDDTPVVPGVVAPPLLTNTSTLYAPTISVGAVTVAPPLLTNTSTLYEPTVTRGTITLAPPLLTNTSELFSPVVAAGGATLQVPLLTNTSTLYTPTVEQGVQTLSPPLLTNTSELFAPTVALLLQQLQVPLLLNTSTMLSPVVAGGEATPTGIDYIGNVPSIGAGSSGGGMMGKYNKARFKQENMRWPTK